MKSYVIIFLTVGAMLFPCMGASQQNLNYENQNKHLETTSSEKYQMPSNSISTWIDLILKTFNILVIIYIFWSGRSERKDDVLRKKYYFWFQDLIIKGGKPHLDSFFKDLDKLIEDHTSAVTNCNAKKSTKLTDYQNIVSNTHRTFNKYKRDFDKNFVSILYVVTQDLGGDLDQMLRDLQDSFGEKIQLASHLYNSAALELLVSDFKKEFLSKIFKWKPDL